MAADPATDGAARDRVIHGGRVATMAGPSLGVAGTTLGVAGSSLEVIEDGAVALRGGAIEWIGRAADLERERPDFAGVRRISAGGRLVTPGLVDCHAHPVFAGDRADEFARRAAGQGYLEIAAAGGGIAATTRATRAASVEQLIGLTRRRLDVALAAGTTTMEAKSGYDLTVAGELRLLEVIRLADAAHAVDLVPTLLAHLVPAERATDRTAFVAELCDQLIPAAAARGLAAAVDVYCDQGAFTLDEARAILGAGRAAGLALRAHAGQFADLEAAELCAELGALSADHLEQVSERGARALADADVVAVMLPGACVQLRLPPPPVARLREAGVRLAIGSDLNPGSSLCESLPIQMWLATTHFGMTVDEAWLGVTRHAAAAIGRPRLGVLEVGAPADLVVWDAASLAEVPYRYGSARPLAVVKAGRVVVGSDG